MPTIPIEWANDYAHELASKKEKAKNDESTGASSSNAGKFTYQKYTGKGREAMYIRWEGRVGRFDEMDVKRYIYLL
jgi:hypothetical protein